MKKLLKKAAAVTLTAAMAASLTACGGGSDADSSSKAAEGQDGEKIGRQEGRDAAQHGDVRLKGKSDPTGAEVLARRVARAAARGGRSGRSLSGSRV